MLLLLFIYALSNSYIRLDFGAYQRVTYLVKFLKEIYNIYIFCVLKLLEYYFGLFQTLLLYCHKYISTNHNIKKNKKQIGTYVHDLVT